MKGLKRLIPQRKKKNASSDSNDNITEALFLNEDDPSAHRRHNVTETNMEPAAPSPDSEPVSRYTTVDEDYDPSLAFLARGNDETTSFGEQAHELSSWPEDPISIPEQSFSTQLNGAKGNFPLGVRKVMQRLRMPDSASLVIQSYADVPSWSKPNYLAVVSVWKRKLWEAGFRVDGSRWFGATSEVDDTGDEDGDDQDTDDADSDTSELPDILFERRTLPPTFNPPSFGVTILGNSHGFDKSGSVSGYVLWINGRGVMIDPPPYSSATLEREGIRPRTIVGIILTHCHADHDAGAFQKVLTGSPVVVITTPTIYKSFIRKYAALSALSPALLRHSHRHKPAIIGSPLRFQGATFHFTYTLHTIPCVGFRVDWRGRSMVFTGDHFNFPPAIDKLQASGVLSKARADDLRNLPLQDTDLLLHEAGAYSHPTRCATQIAPACEKKNVCCPHVSSTRGL
ncbi:Metallo-beta-lactamase superfamily [Fragilaria crotonensis]|nr:Metallo-beta-lactamase superfamily [Fragilaria crotonensis]